MRLEYLQQSFKLLEKALHERLLSNRVKGWDRRLSSSKRMDDHANEVKKVTGFQWEIHESESIVVRSFLETLTYAADAFVNKLAGRIS